jgi:hypothetical protein
LFIQRLGDVLIDVTWLNLGGEDVGGQNECFVLIEKIVKPLVDVLLRQLLNLVLDFAGVGVLVVGKIDELLVGEFLQNALNVTLNLLAGNGVEVADEVQNTAREVLYPAVLVIRVQNFGHDVLLNVAVDAGEASFLVSSRSTF